YFKTLIAGVPETRWQKISQVEVIPGKEKKRILYEFNDTDADYPKDKTPHHIFEERVEQTPDRTALTGDWQREDGKEMPCTLTYRELNEKANRLAQRLQTEGVTGNCLVGLMPDRTIEMLIGLLAILKAGAAYIPLGTEYPKERIAYILEECNAAILLAGARRQPPECASKLLLLNRCCNKEGENEENTRNLPPLSTPTSLAYVIHTSGTTGKPKGVMIENRALVNFIKGITDIIPFTGSDSILALTTISFDIFGLETILPLNTGARVVLGRQEEQLNASAIATVLEKEQITIFQVTPSRLQLIALVPGAFRKLNPLKALLVGGEAFPETLLQKTREIVGGKIYNVYGPTETTIWSTVKELTGEESLNIGKPIANTGIYILSKNRNLQPIGVAGELCIGGDGLARGYLNRPELTAEKFVITYNYLSPNNHSPITNDYIYKTGDLARWLPDGNIECLGRMDHQVKIRGYRIELGEVESQLLEHRLVKQAVVIDREYQDGEKCLCAYIVSANNGKEGKCGINEPGELARVGELKEHLSSSLPDYMIPPYFVFVEEIPLTGSGKINRRALPEPGIISEKEYVAPRNKREESLVQLFADVLGIGKKKIGIDDGFFHLGGHSLKATRLVAKIHKELNVNIPLSELFEVPTIRAMAGFINHLGKDEFQVIEAVEKKNVYPISFTQKRLYILQQRDNKNIVYNISAAMELKGAVDTARLENTFKELIQRHESLRTTFETVAGEPVLKINDGEGFALEYYDVAENEGKTEDIIK
ncbi:MAG: amino acid adenylation domain-containing protein, partial [bacterium]|nr:amino acid adenylation domain-containing protein [bacterium]